VVGIGRGQKTPRIFQTEFLTTRFFATRFFQMPADVVGIGGGKKHRGRLLRGCLTEKIAGKNRWSFFRCAIFPDSADVVGRTTARSWIWASEASCSLHLLPWHGLRRNS
jgi:hypothetical protein